MNLVEPLGQSCSNRECSTECHHDISRRQPLTRTCSLAGFQVAGVRTGCSANHMLSNFPPVPNPYATLNYVRFVVHRTNRPNPVTDATGRQDSVDVRTSMENGRTYLLHNPCRGVATNRGRVECRWRVRGNNARALLRLCRQRRSSPGRGSYRGGIQLEWGCVRRFESGYLVLGPGVPASGLVAPCGSSGAGYLIIRPLPATGTHTWVITPFWDTADERVIDVNRGGRATVTVP